MDGEDVGEFQELKELKEREVDVSERHLCEE